MAGANIKNVDKAFGDFAKEIDNIMYGKLDNWCVEILRSAVRFRFNEPGGHNFTGNLINSICVLLYRKSTGVVKSYFAYDKAGLKLPIRKELSSLNARKKRRQHNIHFGPGSRFGSEDWSGGRSTLKVDNLIPTDESWGQNDATTFAMNWLPKDKNSDFVICVAYTSEYASFVEMQRQTTGYLETESFVGYSAIEWVGLKAA